ncbi:MAG: Chromosomal replication initiator protein DnaA [Fluviibacter phosphoraccumulans EoVTN8]
MNPFWNYCLEKLGEELPAQQFSTWIRPLQLVTDRNSETNELTVSAPNRFILKWVRDNYLGTFQDLADSFYGQPVTVNFTIGAAQAAADSAPTRSAAPLNKPASENTPVAVNNPLPHTSPPPVAPVQAKPSGQGTRLITHFTFNELVVGKANELARAACMKVAEAPGGAYNPLFIYSGAGLGKTHLIHAIGNAVLAADPTKVVRYVHAENYYSDVVRAYQQKAFDSFKRTYRSIDLLLLDDVQFLKGKDRSQEEFFYLFNALVEARKQIVITCDTYPKAIEGLEDRLITRLDWGLTVQIEPPETEMRVAILKKKAETEGKVLTDEVAFFIAKHLRSNVRELEGALTRVLAFAQFHGREITLETAKEALKDIVGAYNRQITVENIQKMVADYYKLTVGDLYSKKRNRMIARPRQVAMWLCKEVTPHSYQMIGESFGGRDHTTVLHAVRTIEDMRTKDQQINHDIHVLLQVLKG